MARREDPEEGSSGYSWMDTYGDMVTLLLCFFVLLYSFSSLDTKKQQELIGAFSGNIDKYQVAAFNESTIRENPITSIDTMVDFENRGAGSNASSAQQQTINSTFDQLYQNIKIYISDNGLQGVLSVSRTEDAIYLRFNEMVLFRPGRADILAENEAMLQHIMKMIHLNVNSISMIKIEGHTDNVPINNAEFSDNWDLSVKRATNTLRMILATGLFEEDMLSAVGYGEYQPIASNDTAEGRSKNRRVDFVLIKADSN